MGTTPTLPEPDPAALAAARELVSALPISENSALRIEAVQRVAANAQEWFDRTYGAANPPGVRATFVLKAEEQARRLLPSAVAETSDVLALLYARRLSTSNLSAAAKFFETAPGRAYAAVAIADDRQIILALAHRLGQAVSPMFLPLVEAARATVARMDAVNRANHKRP
ncbi:MAG TPA: hypothetical protein VNS79_11725 [Sphingobium sp.]|nr:hypothetical protein [Sphingobium sp.]